MSLFRSRSGVAVLVSIIAPIGLLTWAPPARASGLDRDPLLTEAPATPDRGTVRVSGDALGQGANAGATEPASSVTGALLWAPVQRFAADVGLSYWQGGSSGPSVRARFQILSQETDGLDLAVGARYKSTGFTPASGEVELLVAAGRSYGRWDVILNAVYGHETGGPGQDLETKFFAGARLVESLRLGVDARVQAEFVDENGVKVPHSEDVDLIAGPTVAWRVTPQLQLQGLVGVGKPRGVTQLGPAGLLMASYDF
jgi:hypothetical protein